MIFFTIIVQRYKKKAVSAPKKKKKPSYDTESISEEYEKREFIKFLNGFLYSLPERECDIFVRRYFYCDSTANIARRFGIKEPNVLVILSRTRKSLKKALQKGGYTL